jgi:hypothetical protein
MRMLNTTQACGSRMALPPADAKFYPPSLLRKEDQKHTAEA